MQATKMLTPERESVTEADKMKVLGWCQTRLGKEGYTVFWTPAAAVKRGTRPPDLLAMKGPRILRILVLTEDEVDLPETKVRVRDSLMQGETRVFAPWPLRWRMLSNLDRWGFNGVPVAGW